VLQSFGLCAKLEIWLQGKGVEVKQHCGQSGVGWVTAMNMNGTEVKQHFAEPNVGWVTAKHTGWIVIRDSLRRKWKRSDLLWKNGVRTAKDIEKDSENEN
jgi:hypothetical protein